MSYLVIGDVHGCYHTLKKLISENHDDEVIILLGDYIDRGYYVSKTLNYLHLLKTKHPNMIMLRGNHEQEFIELYSCYKAFGSIYETTLYNRYSFLKMDECSPKTIYDFFSSLPLYYETDSFFASHAGVSKYPNNSKEPNDPCGLLWNRMALKALDKLQLHGHTPTLSGPLYNEISNSWNLDTGACFNGSLSAVKINEYGKIKKIIKVKTVPKDVGMESIYKDN